MTAIPNTVSLYSKVMLLTSVAAVILNSSREPISILRNAIFGALVGVPMAKQTHAWLQAGTVSLKLLNQIMLIAEIVLAVGIVLFL